MLFMALMNQAEKLAVQTDEELLLKVGLGDEEAFRNLYQNTDKTMYSFILSIVKNPQDAEELMQEVYLKVWTSAALYKAQGKPLAWMFTIARNLCYMKFRDQKHMADIGLDDLVEGEMGEFCPQLENVADRLALQAALQILKEEERQIVSKYNRAMKKLENYLGKE